MFNPAQENSDIFQIRRQLNLLFSGDKQPDNTLEELIKAASSSSAHKSCCILGLFQGALLQEIAIAQASKPRIHHLINIIEKNLIHKSPNFSAQIENIRKKIDSAETPQEKELYPKEAIQLLADFSVSQFIKNPTKENLYRLYNKRHADPQTRQCFVNACTDQLLSLKNIEKEIKEKLLYLIYQMTLTSFLNIDPKIGIMLQQLKRNKINFFPFISFYTAEIFQKNLNNKNLQYKFLENLAIKGTKEDKQDLIRAFASIIHTLPVAEKQHYLFKQLASLAIHRNPSILSCPKTHLHCTTIFPNMKPQQVDWEEPEKKEPLKICC